MERLRSLRRPDRQVAHDYTAWLAQEDFSCAVPQGPRISVILPVYDTPVHLLRDAIASVQAQTFVNWQLCIADDASPSPHIPALLADMAAQDGRIVVRRLPANAGIAAASNAALSLADGDFVALLDHDDVLAPHALACVANEIAEHPDTKVIFSDEDQLLDGSRCRPYFKPGWNPDLMLSQNLVSHLGVYRRTLLERIGFMRQEFEGSQDYDLALRATAAVARAHIRHIAKPLYHWRQHTGSFSVQRLEDCRSAARAALTASLAGIASVEPDSALPQWLRVVYPLPSPAPLASLIMAKDAATIADADYPHIERVADAAAAHGDILVFLASDLIAHNAGWLRELVSQSSRTAIGCAGARLDRPDGRICDSGGTLDLEAIVQTLSPGSDLDDPGYLGHFLLARTVSAVSGDCFAVRRSVFLAAGGFDARAGAYKTVDLCLRLAEIGLRCLWTPQARLRYQSRPRKIADLKGAAFMRDRWGDILAKDPYKNPNITIRRKNLALAGPHTALRKRLFWS